jgi:hypothetical protein
MFLTEVYAAANICNGFGQVGWGILSDYVSFKKIYALILFLEVFLSLTLNHIVFSKTLFAIWIVSIYLCEAGHATLFPTLACKIYGAQ